MLAGLAAWAAPAFAQTPPAAVVLERCRALLAAVPALGPSGPGPVRVEAAGEDGCRYEGVRFVLGGGATVQPGYEAASVLVRGLSALPPPGGGPWRVARPVALRVEARGVAFSLRTGQAAFDWVNRQQQEAFDVTLDAAYDPAARRLALRELSLDGAALGRASLEGVVEGLDPPDAPVEAERRAAEVGVRSLRLRLDSRAFLLAYALPPLASVLPADDPGGTVERWKAEAARLARALLPAGGASPASAEAVARFVGDFPRPRHPFDLSAEALAGPVGYAEVARALESREALAGLLRAVRVEAIYEGAVR